MSWQAYVDNNLVGAGLQSAAIFGHNGGQWATSAGFAVSAGEAKALIAGFTNPDGLRASGLTIAGIKYIVLRADDRSIYGKKGAGGVITVKTGQAVLIGTYNENLQPGQAANVVEKLADYLIDSNY
jgi:profilin